MGGGSASQSWLVWIWFWWFGLWGFPPLVVSFPLVPRPLDRQTHSRPTQEKGPWANPVSWCLSVNTSPVKCQWLMFKFPQRCSMPTQPTESVSSFSLIEEVCFLLNRINPLTWAFWQLPLLCQCKEFEAFAILQASGPFYPDDIWNFNLQLWVFINLDWNLHCQSHWLWENGFPKMWGEGGSCMCGDD